MNFLTRDPTELHIMIDLETLSTAKNARVTEIGAVVINDVVLPEYRGFHAHVYDITGNPDVSVDTMEWRFEKGLKWKTPEQGAVEGITAWSEFDHWIKKQISAVNVGLFAVEPIIWCKGTDFDIPVINSFVQRNMGIHSKLPWKYNNIRDMRTLMKTFPQFEIPRDTIEHTALADCVNQSKCLIEIAKHIQVLTDKTWDPMD